MCHGGCGVVGGCSYNPLGLIPIRIILWIASILQADLDVLIVPAKCGRWNDYRDAHSDAYDGLWLDRKHISRLPERSVYPFTRGRGRWRALKARSPTAR